MPHLHDTKELDLEMHYTKWNPIPCQKLGRHLSQLLSTFKQQHQPFILASNIHAPVQVSPPSSTDLPPDALNRFSPHAQQTSPSFHYKFPGLPYNNYFLPLVRNSFKIYGITGTTIKDTWTKSRGRVEVGEGGGFSWGGVEGWGEKAYNCN